VATTAGKVHWTRRARRAISWIDGVGLALALWGFLYPRPYALCVLALAAAPLIAIGLAIFSNGAISLNDRRGQTRPDVGGLFLMPFLVLGARALLDFNVMDWKAPLAVAAGLAAGTVALARWAEPEFRTRLWTVLLALLALDGTWGLVIEANGLFDNAPVKVVSAEVIAKRISGGRHTSYNLDVGQTSEPQISGEIDTGRRLYDAIPVGGRLCLAIHGGSLGWRWYKPQACGSAPP